MAKLILIVIFISLNAGADIFDFGSDSAKNSKISSHINKLKKLEIKDDPEFEETFNLTVKGLENSIEEEKLYCSGEATDANSKTIPTNQKQLCMRELKKQYLEATETIFEMKKKYLELIHLRQIKRLSEIQSQIKADIEKNF